MLQTHGTIHLTRYCTIENNRFYFTPKKRNYPCYSEQEIKKTLKEFMCSGDIIYFLKKLKKYIK